jgi:hypothetical protein
MHSLLNYLDAGFRQVGHHGKPFPHNDVRIMSLGERFLETSQLLIGESCPAASLFPVSTITSFKDYI